MSEWRDDVEKRIELLKLDKKHIQEMHSRLTFQQVLSDQDMKLFNVMIDMIDKEIEALHFEIHLDDMLQSDLPFEEYIKRFNQ